MFAMTVESVIKIEFVYIKTQYNIDIAPRPINQPSKNNSSSNNEFFSPISIAATERISLS